MGNISHPSQLSLAIPSWVGAMNSSRKGGCGCGVKADMVRMWVAGKSRKTVITLLNTDHI